MKQILKEGWLYIAVFGLLIFMLLVMRRETSAPFYATALLLVVNQILPASRLSVKKLGDMLVGVGAGLAELTAILLGVGLIVGSFSATGLAGTLVNELIFIAGDNVFVLLLMGAITAFIFGMGMTVTACYIFLAVVLAPALEQGGLNQIAVHLFILYWGMMSYITPPVALAAITAAGVAGSKASRTGLYAMRLGSILFVLPFLFVTNPSLILQGDLLHIVISAATALTAIWLVASALEGYLYRVGTINPAMRLIVLVAAAALIYPERQTDLAGLAIIVGVYIADAALGGRLGSKEAQRYARERAEQQAAEDKPATHEGI